ncbi:AraC family transcriptional regulator [Pontiellaceae bacterium B12227]|nr:AraC family transcriptional regulator [Pontiellaceae bacterium B12227]
MGWFQIIEFILPFAATQLFLFCLLYLFISRKRFADSFAFLAVFLGSMIFFLSCYLLDIMVPELNTAKLIHARMGVLFVVGFPALTAASFCLYQRPLSRRKVVALHGAGCIFAFAYIFTLSLGWRSYFPGRELYFSEFFPNFHDGFIWSKNIAVSAATVLVIIPCSRQLFCFEQRDLKSKAFVSSAILFACLFVAGLMTKQWWIYYVGSILSASVFLTAVYVDIHHLNQTTAFIKDALRFQVLNGGKKSPSRVTELVQNLEASSRGNLDVYKMRIREVLSMIADDAIESGGDVDELLKRNQKNLTRIDQANDLKTLSEMTENETQELSDIISDLPNQRRQQVIQDVKGYIDTHLDEELKINTIAEAFCVSKSYLTNGFKEVEGQTLNQYVTQTRIEKSKELLPNQSITKTAFDVGFSNSNYFSTVFKKITGQTPKAYQNQFKKPI